MSRDETEWIRCPGCSREVLVTELCDCDAPTGPVCVDRCCQQDHPVGRPPWGTAA
jgi:hypothetical protein